MKKNVLTKGHAIVIASLVAALGAAGCELLVDFDRTKIDSGLPDGSVDDATIDSAGDQAVPDSPNTDSTTDSPSETGADSGADTASDAPRDSAMEAAPEAGPGDGGMEAEAATAASLTLTAVAGTAFPNTDVGTSSADLSFKVTNNGGTASSAVTVNVAGSGFVLTAGQDGCTGNTVAANGGNCTFKVHFTPTADGVAAGGLATASALQGGSPNIALTGTGKGLVIAPLTHDFMTADGGMTGTLQVFTITNNASMTTGTLTTTPGGADVAQFTFSADTCNGMTVASTMTCTVSANFTPVAGMMGVKHATLAVSATGVGGSATATLTGTAN